MKTIQQISTTTRQAYLRRAANWARREFKKLRADQSNNGFHDSHLIVRAMEGAERRYVDLGTFGVEYIERGRNQRSPAITYLNAGDTYEWTILYINGQFRVGCWGGIVEKGNYA